MEFLTEKVTSKYLIFVQNVQAQIVKTNLFFIGYIKRTNKKNKGLPGSLAC